MIDSSRVTGTRANGFEQLQFVPLQVITSLTCLGSTFQPIDVLPPFWRTVTLFNPVVHLVGGFRWSVCNLGGVSVGISRLRVLVSRPPA